MNKEYLLKMSDEELAGYMKMLGISSKATKTREAKIELIERRRAKTETIDVLGIPIEVSVKKLRDRRVLDAYQAATTDAQMEAVARQIIGDEQMDALAVAATDEDGTVDVDAMGYAIATILTNKKVKNF
ncbi:hypothetical protein ATOBIA_N05930 [Atopobiaceae bacterium P1]|nr:hypothetical protein ATOBIA_N05930 [Atopobiaceae bacterium P1]